MLRSHFFAPILAAAALIVTASCDDGGSTTATPDTVAASETAQAETGPTEPFTLGPTCAIDPDKYGRKIGDTVNNITLLTYQGERYDLHANCGYDKKVVWLVLGTGWCGACEALAPKLQPIYEEYKSKGLEIMWVLGEDGVGAAPSVAFAQAFVEDKGVTFPVMRDTNFLNVYTSIEQHSTSLPHQYLIDANTMELLNATGGVSAEFEAEVLARLQ